MIYPFHRKPGISVKLCRMGLLNFLLATLILTAPFRTHAQAPLSPPKNHCGTQEDAQLRQAVYAYQSNKPSLKTTAASDTIPLIIHLVGKSNGTGIYPLDQLFNAVCELNKDFQSAGFHFYIQFPIRYIFADHYYVHDFSSGRVMMLDHYVDHGVNVYVVADPAGNCGYFASLYGSPSVALSMACMGPGRHTFAHEIGHFFGLPHTFSGWEHGATPANPERVDGSNCAFAGDGFCDTDADYLSTIWSCPYAGVRLDPVGDTLNPDPTLFMNYALDYCVHRFSPEQIAYMRHIRNTRYAEVQGTHPSFMTFPSIQIKHPGSWMHRDQRYAQWDPVPGATHYYVRIIQKLSGRVIHLQFTQLTHITLPDDFFHNNKYTLEIKPLSSVNLCQEPISHEFTFLDQNTGISTLSSQGFEDWSVYPNPLTGPQLTIQADHLPSGNYSWKLVNMLGQQIDQGSWSPSASPTVINIAPAVGRQGFHIFQIQHKETGWTSSQRIWIADPAR